MVPVNFNFFHSKNSQSTTLSHVFAILYFNNLNPDNVIISDLNTVHELIEQFQDANIYQKINR